MTELTVTEKKVGEIIINYYDTMKKLEKEPDADGKQATVIIMTVNDIMNLFNTTTEE